MSPNTILKGIAILTQLTERRLKDDVLKLVADGALNDTIAPAVYVMKNKQPVLNPEQVKSVDSDVAIIVEDAKQQLQQRMTQATVNQALKRHTTLNELRKSNQPHPAGTVAVLAEKLGLSKSEVRRRKAAGLL